MALKGLLIDYEYCTGCHSCEMACRQIKDLPTGKWGIKLSEDKPWKIEGNKFEYKFVPIPTQLCDMCEDRVNEGRDPYCVHHCQAHVMEYGTLEELTAKANELGRKVAIFAK